MNGHVNGTSDFHVLVIGGGIIGLLIAQGLKKNGIKVSVFEAEPSASHYRPREWGMSIQWGLPLLRDCFSDEMFDRLPSAANDPYFKPPDPGILPAINGGTGEFMKNVPLLKMYRVSRRKFRSLCAEDITVEYGKQIEGLTYDPSGSGVTATFKDGTSYTGSLVVGTDGAHSVVRRSILGPEKAQASSVPFTATNMLAQYGDAEKALYVRQCHPIMAMGIHPDGYWLWISIQEVPDPDKPETWSFQLQATWKKKEGEDCTSLANLKARAETFGEPFKSAFLWLPEDTRVYENKLSYWVPIDWDDRNGRAIIAGDAAHPMTFQRGQGLNHGIADASQIVTQLTRAATHECTLQDAVAAYKHEMIARAAEEVLISKENTEMLHDWTRMQDSPLMKRGGDPNQK
ncbi:MAG: hypothetical protein M1833_003921 [Piccolia ochrophora]|nr:MAG: hypothetical protein M1833_003921 [Piccolia ochrophora]